jgi:hypothetical protein
MRAAKSRACSRQMRGLDASERAAAEAAAAARARHAANFSAAAAGGGLAAAGAAAVAAAGRWLAVAEEHLLLLEMGHLVASLQQYIMDRLMHGAWARLEKVGGGLCLREGR